MIELAIVSVLIALLLGFLLGVIFAAHQQEELERDRRLDRWWYEEGPGAR